MASPSSNPSAFTYEVLYYEGTGLGELPRILVSYAGWKLVLGFVDDNTLPSFKPNLLFGQVPKLTVKDAEGKSVFEVVQSRAIIKYLATLAGLFGTTPEERAVIEQYLEAVRDAADGIGKHWWTEKGRKEEIPKLIQSGGHLEKWCSKFDTLLSKNASGFLVGNAITVADLALFQFTEEVNTLYGDHVAKNYKHIAAHLHKIGEIPNIKKYTSDSARVKSFYSMPEVY